MDLRCSLWLEVEKDGREQVDSAMTCDVDAFRLVPALLEVKLMKSWLTSMWSKLVDFFPIDE